MLIRRSAAALLLAASLNPALAQTEPAPQPDTGASARPASDRAFAKFGPRLSVDFPGGTVQAYIDALRAAAGDEAVNIVLSEGAAAAQLPAIRLLDVNVYSALEAATFAAQTEPGASWQVRPLVFDANSKPSFALVLSRPQLLQMNEQPTMRVLNLAEALAGGNIEPQTALTAVQAALEVLGGPSPAQLKFHKDTGLLFVSGTTPQLGAAGDVLAKLAQSSQNAAGAERMRREQERAQQVLRPRFQAALETAEAKLAAAQAESERAAQAYKAGAAPQAETLRAQADLARAREEVIAAESQLALIEYPATATAELNMAGFWERLANLERQVAQMQKAMGLGTAAPAGEPVPSR